MDWTSPPPDFKAVLLERVVPVRDEARFYYLSYQPRLFHAGAVVRVYGRIGESQHVLPPVPSTVWPRPGR